MADCSHPLLPLTSGRAAHLLLFLIRKGPSFSSVFLTVVSSFAFTVFHWAPLQFIHKLCRSGNYFTSKSRLLATINNDFKSLLKSQHMEGLQGRLSGPQPWTPEAEGILCSSPFSGWRCRRVARSPGGSVRETGDSRCFFPWLTQRHPHGVSARESPSPNKDLLGSLNIN